MVAEAIQKGYKQTEIGVIPEDWDVKNIIDCSTLKARIGWQGLTTLEYLQDGDYFLVGGIDFKKGKIDWDNCFYVSENRYKQDPNIQLRVGDILVTKDGTIGKIAYIDRLPLPTTLNSGVFVIRPKNNEYVSRYLFYILISEYFDKFLNKLKAGSTISHLYQKDFISFDFFLPKSLEEQSAIAQVLSETDELIQQLNKLISKKKNIKKGVMQELLTGKKRLFGFSGEWENVIFDDIICNFTTGLNPRQNFVLNSGGNIYYVTIKNFFKGKLYLNEKCDKIDTVAFLKINKRSDLKKDDIIFASIGRVGDAYLIKVTPKNWNINESVFSLRPNKQKIEPLFLYYILTTENIKNFLDNQITGSTFQSIKMADLRKVPCKIPCLKEEQREIAKILSDIDSDIEELEQKRNKYQMIKKGMMQQLLTGRIRLKWKK